MTYFSRLILDPRSQLVRRDVGDTQQMHRTVMSCLTEKGLDQARSSGGILYRLEVDRLGQIVVLVQTAAQPTWALPDGYLLAPVDIRNIDRLWEMIAVGARFRFRLVGNPTRDIVQRDAEGVRTHSKRIPIRSDVERRAWLDHQSTGKGFRVLEVMIIQPSENKIVGRAKDGPRTIEIVRYDGLLEVTDIVLFKNAIEVGIGRGKSFGAGLLSVAPARSNTLVDDDGI